LLYHKGYDREGRRIAVGSSPELKGRGEDSEPHAFLLIDEGESLCTAILSTTHALALRQGLDRFLAEAAVHTAQAAE
jgi:hypothetical protein